MKKRKTSYLAAILLILILAGCTTGHQKEEETMNYQQITPKEAKEIMDTREGYIILDVRTREEYDTGHIEGAVCLPNEEIADTEPELLPDKSRQILVYFRSGRRSKEAAQKLADMGYENVLEFGGILDWPYEIVR